MEALRAQSGAGGKWEGKLRVQEGFLPWIKGPWTKEKSESEDGGERPPYCWDCPAHPSPLFPRSLGNWSWMVWGIGGGMELRAQGASPSPTTRLFQCIVL